MLMALMLCLAFPVFGGLTVTSEVPLVVSQNETLNLGIIVVNDSTVFETATCKVGINEFANISASDDLEIPYPVLASKGKYKAVVACNTSSEAALANIDFYVTKNGFEPATEFFKVFIWLLFIISTIGLFLTLFISIAKFITLDETVFDVLLSWSFVILNMIVIYLSENFLISTFIEDLSIVFLKATIFTNVIFPLAAFIITMIVKGFEKRRPLNVREMHGRRLM